jgi:hypothetical protein
MKTFLMSLLFVSGAALATTPAESISLVCTGRQVASGGAVYAPFVIKASTTGVYVNPIWNIEAGWQGKTPLVAEGTACGDTLTAESTCSEQRGGTGLFSLTQTCGPVIHGGGVPRAQYISSITLSEDYANGYFNCQGTGSSQHIELIGCQHQ